MSDFINMGGYGGYIWSAYGVTFAVLAALSVQIVLRRRRLRARVAHLDALAADKGRS